MKSARGMPLVVREKNGEKTKHQNVRSGSTEAYSVEALCGHGALDYNGDVKVLLTQRSSSQVLLTKRSGNQVLLTKRWKGYAPTVCTLCTPCLYDKMGRIPRSVYKTCLGIDSTAFTDVLTATKS